MLKRVVLLALSALLILTASAACTSKKASEVGTGGETTVAPKDKPGSTVAEGDFCAAMDVLRDIVAEGDEIEDFEDQREFWADEADASLAAIDEAIADAPSGLDSELETMREGFDAAIEAYSEATDEDDFEQRLDDTIPSDFEDSVESVSDAADEECGSPLLPDSGAGTTTTSTRRR